MVYVIVCYLYYKVYYKLLINLGVEVIWTINILRHILSIEHGEEDSKFLSNFYSRAVQIFWTNSYSR
jgi:hypothetical protein